MWEGLYTMTGSGHEVSPPRRMSVGAKRNPASERAVLDAARALMIDKGYAGFSIDEVARRAGAGKPTIYRWWPTKADLIVAVYSEDKAAAIVPPDTGSLARDIVDYTEALWRFWRETPSGRAFRGLVAEAQASEAALEALRDKFLPARTLELRRLFGRGVVRGEIAAADADLLLVLYIGFNWFYVLTDQLEAGRASIPAAMRLIAASAP